MAVAPGRELKIGKIIDKTLGVIEHSAAAVLIYVAGLTVAIGALTYFTLDMTAPLQQAAFGLVRLVVGIVAAYFLLDTMVGKTGLRSRQRDEVLLAYAVMSVLYTLGFVVGLILIVIPGLVVLARWSIAGPWLVARGDSATRALGESWERTRGNEFQILVATLGVLIVPIAVTIACNILFEPENPIGIGATQLAASAMSAVLQALGVALYGLLVGATPAEPPPAN